MYGFVSPLTAKVAYNKNFDKGWKGLGAITEMTVDEFSEWVKGDLTKPVSDKINVATVATVADTEKPETEKPEKVKGEPLPHSDKEPWQMTKFQWEQRQIALNGVNWATMMWANQTQGRPEDLPTPTTGDLYGVKAPTHADSNYIVGLPGGPTRLFRYRGISGYRADNNERFNGWEEVTNDILKPVEHREAIQKALDEGKDVPKEVLKDYPGLKAVETKKTDTEKKVSVELSDNNYAILNGKKISYDVKIEDTGETVSYSEDAGDAMRSIDDRIEKLKALQACIG